MGTINYGSSDYINIGLDCRALYEDEDNIIEGYYNYVQEILEKYSFYYWDINVKAGYYQGFYIDIENNLPVYFEDWEEKKEAQKEVTQIKKFLLECAEVGLVLYTPGWCTGYGTKQETIQSIKIAINDMRREIHDTSTYCR